MCLKQFVLLVFRSPFQNEFSRKFFGCALVRDYLGGFRGIRETQSVPATILGLGEKLLIQTMGSG